MLIHCAFILQGPIYLFYFLFFYVGPWSSRAILTWSSSGLLYHHHNSDCSQSYAFRGHGYSMVRTGYEGQVAAECFLLSLGINSDAWLLFWESHHSFLRAAASTLPWGPYFTSLHHFMTPFARFGLISPFLLSHGLPLKKKSICAIVKWIKALVTNANDLGLASDDLKLVLGPNCGGKEQPPASYPWCPHVYLPPGERKE